MDQPNQHSKRELDKKSKDNQDSSIKKMLPLLKIGLETFYPPANESDKEG